MAKGYPMKTHAGVLLALTGAAVMLGACGKPLCMPPEDPWKASPGSRDGIANISLPTYNLFAAVPQDRADFAAARLEKKRLIELSPDDLKDLGVKAPAGTSGKTAYLMRALSTRDPKGEYKLIMLKNDLWIRYVRSDEDMCATLYHEGIVVWLDQAPGRVLVTSSIKE